MPYWISSTLVATPALLWMFVGVGLPWALVALPRIDWRDRVMAGCLALAFGPALVTAWMFVLGTVQGANLLRWDYVAIGTALIALVGWILVWRLKRVSAEPRVGEVENNSSYQRRFDEWLLIGLIAAALVVRWLGVAYWPTTAYDALWVYGYEGRLYTLMGHIPATIEYYPQFLPLQHTFLQLAVGGLDDHAARAVLPWLHVGSILAVYVMGHRLFSRRVGVYAAAIWALYPHMGEWSRYGDLEVPVTYMFTGASAFFVLAWRLVSSQANTLYNARRYAVIAGLFLGIGLWTKPTMGAFIWGVVLIAVLAVARLWWYRRGIITNIIHEMRPRIEVLLITGLVCLPLGSVWYLRNVFLGHSAVIFPDGYWQTLAARGGVEFGWPLLALLVLIIWVVWQNFVLPAKNRLRSRFFWLQLWGGLALIIAGVWPSIANTGRIGITDNRIGPLEWVSLTIGALIIVVVLWRWAEGKWTTDAREEVATVGWLWLLGLPYFITWFYSYSYHYRLSFAIVPLMIMPIALLLGRLYSAVDTQVIRRVWVNRVVAIIIIFLSLPGIVNALYDGNAGWDWLWTDKLPDDHARYTSGNKALMTVVDGLQKYIDENPDQPLTVVAPQVKRLPFFFPTVDIQIDHMPTELNELDGVTYFIYGKPEAGGDFNTFVPGQNQVLSALSRATTNTDVGSTIMRRAWGDDDGIFKYTVYELHLENRFQPPAFINGPTQEGDVQFGEFTRLLGYDIGGLEFWPGRKLVMHLFWQVLKRPQADYMIYIHLRDQDGNVVQAWDGPVSWTQDGNTYSTLVWEAGEYITDERTLVFDQVNVPVNTNYRMVVGMYELTSQSRVPMSINGKAAGEGYEISVPFSVVSPPSN